MFQTPYFHFSTNLHKYSGKISIIIPTSKKYEWNWSTQEHHTYWGVCWLEVLGIIQALHRPSTTRLYTKWLFGAAILCTTLPNLSHCLLSWESWVSCFSYSCWSTILSHMLYILSFKTNFNSIQSEVGWVKRGRLLRVIVQSQPWVKSELYSLHVCVNHF